MSGPLRLILFDVDGTLVDSQDDIVRAMELSFEALPSCPCKKHTKRTKRPNIFFQIMIDFLHI